MDGMEAVDGKAAAVGGVGVLGVTGEARVAGRRWAGVRGDGGGFQGQRHAHERNGSA